MSSLTGTAPFGHRLTMQAAFVALLLCCAPLLVFVVRGWSNIVLFAGAALSLYLLARGDLSASSLEEGERRLARLLAVVMAAPLAAVALAAALRVDPYPPQFDAPSRFLVALPILLFVVRSRIPVARILSWVLPLSLAVGLVFLEAQGADPRWPAGRETTRVVDPLVFCYLTFTFGLMCLVTVSPRQWREAPWSVVLRLAGAALGLYLSLRSGSRTGWLALPLVVGVWLYCLWGTRTRWAIPAVLLVAFGSPVLAYLLVPTVGSRIDEAAQELLAYPWEGMAPDTSLGGRITALRIAFDLFVEHPWAGMGNLSHVPIASLPSFSYASPWATKLAYHSAFHNQIVTNAVRTGVGGLLATAALLLVPLAVCTRSLLRDGPRVRPEAAMGFAFFACMLVSSMSTEIVDLKYMASLYAVMTAVLCGACLAPPRDGAAA